MKIFLLLTLLSTALMSCQPAAEKATTATKEVAVIGYEFNDKGEKLNLIAGDLSVTEIWMEYIQAHNDKDVDKIAAMDAEDVTIYTSAGNVIKGSEAHKLALSAWFDTSNPSWKVNWMVSNTVDVKDGENRNWLTTGNDVTDVVDGVETTIHSILDANIVDGKIKRLNIYDRAKNKE
ncbi:hypothetical protein N9R08_01650 [Flavobacteriaceae bacterium]|nr:hypothetical protein [Flavobacteriaceae bacterium]